MFTSSSHGHSFIHLNLVTDKSNELVYDVTTGAWTEVLIDNDNTIQPRVSSTQYLGNTVVTHIVTVNGGIAEIKDDVNTFCNYIYDGVPMYKEFTSPVLSAGGDASVFHHRLRLEHEKQESESIVVFEYSDDSGSTWTNVGAKDLANKTRTEFFRLGSAENRMYRFHSDSNAKLNTSGGFVDVTRGYF
jgi:hypothetical protein